jgi:hypothetical protein
VAQRRHGPTLPYTSATGKCRAKPVSCPCDLHTHSLFILLGWDIAARLSRAECPFFPAIVKLNPPAVLTRSGTERQRSRTGDQGTYPVVRCAIVSLLPASLVSIRGTRVQARVSNEDRMSPFRRYLHFIVDGAEHAAISSGRQWLQYQAFRSPIMDKNQSLPRDAATRLGKPFKLRQ